MFIKYEELIEMFQFRASLRSCVSFQYDGSIEENTHNVEVMRLKSIDKDLEGTDNWDAVYEIVKGNDAGYFNIVTDPKTNEGILMLVKVQFS